MYQTTTDKNLLLRAARTQRCAGEALLDAIQPRLIVVADSEYPASEQAGAKLKERLARRNAPVICTRAAGAVTIEFRRSGWEARTMNGLRFKSELRAK